MPEEASTARTFWFYEKTDWKGMRRHLAEIDWRVIDTLHPDQAAEFLTNTLENACYLFIPHKDTVAKKRTHPWINDRVLELTQEKKLAEGTSRERECRDRCSAGIMEEYGKYVSKERAALQNTPRGNKS